MDQLLSDLLTPFDSEEHLVIDDLIRQIEEARVKIESSDFPDWQGRLAKMAHLRIRSSNTLRRGEMDSWVKANAFVEEQICQRRLPSWSAICEINSILTGTEQNEVVRKSPIYIGPFVASPHEKLNEHILFFAENILPLEKQSRHPLVFAALLQYWIVSLHPFKDANGRTAVLIADWVNLYFGFFPQVFEMQIDAVIGHFSNRASKATPARATLKVLTNNLKSYQAFLS